MAMRRKTSLIWYHFSQNDIKEAQCNYCSCNIAISSGNTGNLTRHLKRKHPTISLLPIKQEPVETTSETSQCPIANHIIERSQDNQDILVSLPLPSSSSGQNLMTDDIQNTKSLPTQKAKELDEQLIKLIAKEYHSFRIVEGDEFKKFIYMLNPRYSPPTRKTLANVLLPQLHAKVQNEVEQLVAEALAICLTLDAWTSINNESFIAITAHYIDTNTNLRSNLLCCIQYDERHTSENLCEFLKEEMEKWKISNKVTAIVSDNADNIVAAVQSGGWPHIGCFAQTLNSVVEVGILEIQTTVTKVKHIVEFFKYNSQAQIKLQEIQNQMNLPVLKLKQDVVTRWNSTYDMLNRVVASKNAIIATLALFQHELALSTEEWQVVEEAIPILKAFYEITTEISTENQVILSKVIVYWRLLHQHISNYNLQEYSPEIQKMIASLKTQIHRFYDENDVESNEIYAEATILDPRFKNRGFRDVIKYEQAVLVLKKKLSHSTWTNRSENCESRTTAWPWPEAVGGPSNSTSSIWQKFDEEVSALVPCDHITAGIVELDKYIQEPLLSRNENPLIWWKDRKPMYPILYSYILKRLSLVATSVPCERTFSKAGVIMTETRSRLQSKKLAELLFIASNME